jgi:hypothetical protein
MVDDEKNSFLPLLIIVTNLQWIIKLGEVISRKAVDICKFLLRWTWEIKIILSPFYYINGSLIQGKERKRKNERKKRKENNIMTEGRRKEEKRKYGNKKVEPERE